MQRLPKAAPLIVTDLLSALVALSMQLRVTPNWGFGGCQPIQSGASQSPPRQPVGCWCGALGSPSGHLGTRYILPDTISSPHRRAESWIVRCFWGCGCQTSGERRWQDETNAAACALLSKPPPLFHLSERAYQSSWRNGRFLEWFALILTMTNAFPLSM
jgi:hypothetical protein